MLVFLLQLGLSLSLLRLLLGSYTANRIVPPDPSFVLPDPVSFSASHTPALFNTVQNASLYFQNYLLARQQVCNATKVYYFSTPQQQPPQSLFFTIYQQTVALLHVLSQEPDAILITEANDFFLPLSPCTLGSLWTRYEPPPRLHDCHSPVTTALQLQHALKWDISPLWDWSFFLREAMRFVSRPNPVLSAQIQYLHTNVYPPPFPEWRPFRYPASRVCVQLDSRNQTSLQFRIVKGLEIHIYTHSGVGMDQVLVLGSRDLGELIRRELHQRGTIAKHDLLQRRQNPHRPIPVLMSSDQNDKLSWVAHAFVFAECDLMVGDFSRNFPRFVFLLSSAWRFTNAFPYYYDLTGSHFSEEFDDTDEDENRLLLLSIIK